MDTLDRLINRPVRTATMKIVLDPNRQDDALKARQALQMARLKAAANDNDTQALAELDEAETAYAAAIEGVETAEIFLASAGWQRFTDLCTEYPATSEQIKTAKRLADQAPTFNPDEVCPRLLAESITAIVIDGDEASGITDIDLDAARRLWASDTWPRDDREDLIGLAISLTQSGSKWDAALGKG